MIEGRRFTALWAALALLCSPAAFAADTTDGFAQVRGVLLDAEGLPAVEYQLALRSTAGDLFLSSPTARDGSFIIDEIVPGEYRLVAFGPHGVEYPVASKPVMLAPGQVERTEVRIGGEGVVPGRTHPADAESTAGGAVGRSFWASKGWIIAVAVGGAFAVVNWLDDDSPREPSASPSTP